MTTYQPPSSSSDSKNPNRSRPAENLHKAERNAHPLGRDLPPWIPKGKKWLKLPQSLRDAVQRILAPIYRRLVLDAPNDLERSVGHSLVHLTWLELCDIAKMARPAANPDDPDLFARQTRKAIDRYLRRAKTKCQTAAFLQKVQVIQNTLKSHPVGQMPPLLFPLPSIAEIVSAQNPIPFPAPVEFDSLHSPQPEADPFLKLENETNDDQPDPCEADPFLKLENETDDDQPDHPALILLAQRPDIFTHQGYIAAGHRIKNGKTYGPYYRLAYRENGRLSSIYLGVQSPLVDRVRRKLESLQRHRIQSRILRNTQRQVQNSLQLEKQHLKSLLRPFGLRLKGFEIRGWRFTPYRRFLPRRRCFTPKFHFSMPKLPKTNSFNPEPAATARQRR